MHTTHTHTCMHAYKRTEDNKKIVLNPKQLHLHWWPKTGPTDVVSELHIETQPNSTMAFSWTTVVCRHVRIYTVPIILQFGTECDDSVAIPGAIWALSWENLFMPCASNKGADQPAQPHSQRLYCSLPGQYNISTCYIWKFKTLVSLISWAGWSESPKTGFLVTRLIL